MEEERIALEFITVYRKYKEKSFHRKKTRMEEGRLLERNAGRRGRLNKINK